ncbi:MAG: type II toxin-antitoxin system Phd/YefM family antitoxin [Pirellulales bacterium]|nr:type II toxin-antitoxin system Phd/YefM family antitoxin [Pirellulales bacterium]
MNTINLNNSDHDFEQIITQVLANAEPMVVDTGSGESVVLMPLDDFTAWQETAYLLRTPANAAHLNKSIAEAQAGKTVSRPLEEQ